MTQERSDEIEVAERGGHVQRGFGNAGGDISVEN